MTIEKLHVGYSCNIYSTFSTEFNVEILPKCNSGAAGLSSALNVEWDAFRGESGPLPWDTYLSTGTLINKNTLDAFKQCDKVGAMLNFWVTLKLRCIGLPPVSETAWRKCSLICQLNTMIHKLHRLHLLPGRHHGGGGVETGGEHRERAGARKSGPAQPIRPPNIRREVTICDGESLICKHQFESNMSNC